ncbi:MAG: holo-ACP synthase [Bauldia sp.]|nr:holo-ACP synthase [Bauldia sp.]
MTPGIGVDLVQLARMRDAIDLGGEAFVDKTFTEGEQELSRRKPDPVAWLAMAFAAKEAVLKAFAIRWEDRMSPMDIAVFEGANDEPRVLLTGRFAEVARERGVREVRLSLSFDGDYAIAVAALD